MKLIKESEVSNTIRVAIVADSASAKFGGEAVLPLHYYRTLRAREIPVWLIVHERTRAELCELYPEDADFIRFVADTYIHKILWRVCKLIPARISNFTFGYLMRIATQVAQKKLLKELVQIESITIVHQPTPVSPKEPSLIYGLGVPVIIGPMNGGMNYPIAFSKKQSFIEKAFIAAGRGSANAMNRLLPGKLKAAKLLVANERTKFALPDCVAGVPIDVVVENGVDLSTWIGVNKIVDLHIDQRDTKFVYLGRLVDWKAVDLLLIAFERASRRAAISLEIIGDGPMRTVLEQQASNLGLVDLVTGKGPVSFLGWLKQTDCAERLKNADVLVLPSLLECGGAVVLEAMSMSLPVIATNWGGPADYLDSDCGILIEPKSPDLFIEDFASAIVKLADDSEYRFELGRAGRKKIDSHFDWDIKIDNILKIYADVIGCTDFSKEK